MPQPSPITPDNHLRSHHSVAESNTHFLEKEPEIPKYAGPTDSRRVVKIKPLDKELFFDGTNMPIEKFIKRYERAGEADGASATDLAKQIISFVRGGDLKDEVEEMEGYETVEWEELKKQLLDRFGKSLPLVKYTKQDLKDLVNTAAKKGGIQTLEEFKIFRSKFEMITHYLVRMGYNSDLEDFRELLLEALSLPLETAVTDRELVRDNKMRVSKDGGDILPVTKIIVQYIQREVQSTSVMERRSLGRLEQTNVEPAKPIRNPIPRPPAPAPQPESYEKKIQDLTRQLASLTAGKMAPPHQPLDANLPSSAAPTNVPFKKPDFKCYYCFQDTHSRNRCSLFAFDESRGLVKREGRDYLLPDNTKIAWDTRRAIKEEVDKFDRNSKKTTAAVVTSSFGELEECEVQEHAAYDVDLGKRTRSEKEPEKSGSGKKGRVEKDSVMNIDAKDLIKKATAQKSAQGPSKTTTVPAKVRFEEQRSEKEEREKPAKKTHLEKTLAKEYPGVEEETAKRMLSEGKMTLSYGEIFAILNGVVDVFKKKISNRRVPVEESESSNHASLENNDRDELSVTHYSCPLGYIKLSINGTNSEALLDTGSMVNLMPEHMAQNLGLVVTKKPMNLKGIGGHQMGIIGIAEGVEVVIGKITRPVHFWIARGAVQFILGKPFLIDAAATIKKNYDLFVCVPVPVAMDGPREDSSSCLPTVFPPDGNFAADMRVLVQKFAVLFEPIERASERQRVVEHLVDTGDAPPVSQPVRQMSPALLEF
ncbi:hypothetical protein PGT21_036008 [Puccinia graminis f. sp. tritici]|uniref:Peptidase A2 domain-containing protein n=1 Tax=Puccinia graminis f. sp. tritici TaxID=56615 RepID=A0A5B0NUS8_PUCGR|nr:hypothetical protein PGT21_036008 [Puccinia graminis f. sp. tritici]